MTRISTLAAAALVVTTGIAAMTGTASAADYHSRHYGYVPQFQDQGPGDYWRHRRHHGRPEFQRRYEGPQFYGQLPPPPPPPVYYNQYAPPQNSYTYSPPDMPWLHILAN